MKDEGVPAAVAAIGALAEPTRRTIYDFVVAQSAPVGREEVARAVGVAHHVARFHLDRLHEAGLLQVEYRRPPGRGGPGAGHPTKLYRLAPGEFAYSMPERRYDLAGLVLSRAVAQVIGEGTPIDRALQAAAADAGRDLGENARPCTSGRHPSRTALVSAIETLEACGFGPRPDADRYVLRNCPFRILAQEEPEVICRMNLALVRGLLDQVGAPTAMARLDPGDGRCCVTIGS